MRLFRILYYDFGARTERVAAVLHDTRPQAEQKFNTLMLQEARNVTVLRVTEFPAQKGKVIW